MLLATESGFDEREARLHEHDQDGADHDPQEVRVDGDIRVRGDEGTVVDGVGDLRARRNARRSDDYKGATRDERGPPHPGLQDVLLLLRDARGETRAPLTGLPLPVTALRARWPERKAVRFQEFAANVNDVARTSDAFLNVVGSRAMTTASDRITVAIVPHTHWDREWYSPFQTFRMRLVKLLDVLLPMLETDMSYARFLLDGQTAILDDYLEVRPEMEATLRRLAASGRVSVGPWMVQMDEFMVSGETMVRDLQYGLAQAAGVRRRDAGRLPPRHLRAHRADAAVARAGRHRARGRLARHPVECRQDRLLVGGARRLSGALRIPLRLLLERARHPRGRQGTRAARDRLPDRSSATSASPTCC